MNKTNNKIQRLINKQILLLLNFETNFFFPFIYFQRPASVQLNSSRSTHPITSHTSLHAYWNDPNFDTQSQTSNCSSTTKKRRAPRPPGYISPTLNEQQIILVQNPDYHQSQESLTESINGTKQKRKAPVVPNTTDDNQEIEIEKTDEQQIELPNTSQSPDQNTHSITPIYSQIQKNKESTPIESHYSTVKPTPTPPPIRQQEEIIIQSSPSPPPIVQQEDTTVKSSSSPTSTLQREEIIIKSPKNYSVNEIIQAGIADPPTPAVTTVVSPKKSSKKSSSTDGIIKIINDHNERAQIYQANEKQDENPSYFRVAKSRHGKFETDNQGFINNSTNIFDSTNTKEKSPTPIQV